MYGAGASGNVSGDTPKKREVALILLNNQMHQMVRTGVGQQVLNQLRRQAHRGKEVVVYRHAGTRNFILAETNGRVTREIAVLYGWPRLSQLVMRGLVRSLRPLPNTQRAKNRLIKASLDKKAVHVRDLGRFKRELMARVQRVTKGTKKDHPAIKWKQIKGEGV